MPVAVVVSPQMGFQYWRRHALDLLDQLARSASGGATEQEEVFCSTPCLPLLPELNTGEWGGMMMIQQTCKAIADLVHSSRWQTGQA